MSIADRIKEARVLAKLTQQELADKCGTTRSSITNYEMGRREPDVLAIKKIAKALGVSGDWLLETTMIDDKPTERDELLLIYDTVNDAGKAQILKQARYVAADEEYKKKADVI